MADLTEVAPREINPTEHPSPLHLTREALYDLVWTEPVVTLAKRWGVSDVAVAKWCRKLNVPRPERGYWAKAAAGHVGKRRPLPHAKKGERTEVVVSTGSPKKPTEAKPASEALPDDLKALYLAFDTPSSKIEVSAELRGQHKLVAQVQSTLQHARTDDAGILIARSRSHLDLKVTRDTLDRALRIADAMIKALEQNGIRIAVRETDDQGQDRRRTTATVFGEKIAFDLTEKVTRSERPLTREEKQKLAKDPYFWIRDKYAYSPTGNLRLRIVESYLPFRASWADGKRHRVEDHLTDFAKALVLVANKRRLDRAEAERRQKAWEEEARRRREAEEAWELEQKRRKALDLLEERWLKSCRIRQFAATVEQAAAQAGATASDGDELQRWLTWAISYADALDPFKVPPFLALFDRTTEDVQLEPRRYFW